MNLMKDIKFLFIVPTFNAGLNINKFSKLLIEQTYYKWRVIFVDGGSCQRDLHLFRELICLDKRFSLVNQINKSTRIFGAMNQGFKLAEEDEYLFFWGSDDFIYEKKTLENINKIILAYRNNLEEKNHFYIFKSRYINTRKNLLSRFSTFPRNKNFSIFQRKYFSILLFLGFTPPHQATIFTPISRKILNKYSTEYKLSADLDYFLTISKSNDISYKYENLQVVNMSDSGISSKYLFQRLSNVFCIYLKFYKFLFFIPFTSRYFFKIFSKFKSAFTRS